MRPLLPALTVTRPDGEGEWLIHSGDQLVDTVRGHYDAWEALDQAERRVIGEVCWRRIEDGFEAVTEG